MCAHKCTYNTRNKILRGDEQDSVDYLYSNIYGRYKNRRLSFLDKRLRRINLRASPAGGAAVSHASRGRGRGRVRVCSEYGGLGFGLGVGGGHVVGVDVGDVGRGAQAAAQAGGRVRAEPLLQVLERGLEGLDHAQLQGNTRPEPPVPAAPPPPIARDSSVVWMSPMSVLSDAATLPCTTVPVRMHLRVLVKRGASRNAGADKTNKHVAGVRLFCGGELLGRRGLQDRRENRTSSNANGEPTTLVHGKIGSYEIPEKHFVSKQ